jgi:hypothetical protein
VPGDVSNLQKNFPYFNVQSTGLEFPRCWKFPRGSPSTWPAIDRTVRRRNSLLGGEVSGNTGRVTELQRERICVTSGTDVAAMSRRMIRVSDNIYLFIYLLFIYLSIYLSIYLPTYLSIYLYIYLSIEPQQDMHCCVC